MPDNEPDIFNDLVNEIKDGKFMDNQPDPEPPAPPETPSPEEPNPPEEEVKNPAEGEKDDIDSQDPPENLSTKAKDDWEKVRETSRNYKAKAKAAEDAMAEQARNFETEKAAFLKQIEEASAASGELTELRARKEAFDANEKEFSVYAVERTKDFQDTIVAPLKAIDARIAQIAKASGVDAAKLEDAIAEPDFEKQQELMEAVLPELSQFQQGHVIRMAEDARGLLDRRAQILENAHTAQKELKEKGEKESATARETNGKAFKAAVKNTVDSLIQRLPFVELVDGETKEGVFKSMLDKAEAEDFDAATPATKGVAAVSVIALERSIRQAQKREEYIKTLEARIAESNKAAPSLGGGDPPAPVAETEEDFMASVHNVLGLQQSRNILTTLGK